VISKPGFTSPVPYDVIAYDGGQLNQTSLSSLLLTAADRQTRWPPAAVTCGAECLAMEQLSHTTTDTADQADEEIFTFPVSDEALEAAAGTERGEVLKNFLSNVQLS
jgi:hypothetical protein